MDQLWSSQIVAAFDGTDAHPRSRHLLALFAARRALPCWQLYCDGTEPIEAVHAAEAFLADGRSIRIDSRFSIPAVPSYKGFPINDCRECDTGAAAEAVAHMVRMIASNDPRELVDCLDAADAAFDQSPLLQHDQFRRWLAEVAVPAALQGRSLSDEEQSRFRDYTPAEIDAERERSGAHW